MDLGCVERYIIKKRIKKRKGVKYSYNPRKYIQMSNLNQE
jgi:hypothetical protein